MTLKLSSKSLLIIKTIIWLLYSFYAVYMFKTIKSFDLKVAILLCGIIIQMTIISFLNHWHRYRQPFLLDWFRLATLFYIVLNFLFLMETLDKNYALLVDNVVMVESSQALPAIMVVFVGLIALRFSEVFIIRIKKRNFTSWKTPRKTKNKPSLINKNFFYVFTLILGFVQFYLLLKGVVGYGSEVRNLAGNFSFLLQAIYILGPLVLVSYAIMIFKYHFKNRIFILIFVIYFLLQIISGFISGMKEEIIIPIIIVLVPYLLAGHKIPRKLAFGVVIFVVLLYPVNNNYRAILNSPVQTSKVDGFLKAIENTLENNFFDNLKTGSENYQSRASLFPILMYSIENERHWLDYKYMNRYIYLPISWVLPRFLIESKPMADTGSKLYYLTTGRYDTSITPTTYGWSYYEGGYIPVILTFFLLGLFISKLQSIFLRNNFLHLIIYASFLIALLKVEADIYFLISGLLQKLLIGVIFFKLFFKYERKKFNDYSIAV